MDHRYIKKNEIIDRYILGKLSREEEEIFEKHYFKCDRCFRDVKEAEKLILSMKDAANKNLLSYEIEFKSSFLNNFKSIIFSPAFQIITICLLLLLIYPAWLGIFKTSILNIEIEEMKQPKANIENYFLEQVRGEEQLPSIKISIGKEEKRFVLNFNILEKVSHSPTYKGEIIDPKGTIVWRSEKLEAIGEYEVYSIACNSAFFKQGDYRLVIYEVDSITNKISNKILFNFNIIR
ncbi:MAG: hypothetical protein ACFFC7_33985 [Candidatus Hermodarchaeota archaeon]